METTRKVISYGRRNNNFVRARPSLLIRSDSPLIGQSASEDETPVFSSSQKSPHTAQSRPGGKSDRTVLARTTTTRNRKENLVQPVVSKKGRTPSAQLSTKVSPKGSNKARQFPVGGRPNAKLPRRSLGTKESEPPHARAPLGIKNGGDGSNDGEFSWSGSSILSSQQSDDHPLSIISISSDGSSWAQEAVALKANSKALKTTRGVSVPRRRIVISSDEEDEEVVEEIKFSPRKKAAAKSKIIVISSDEEDTPKPVRVPSTTAAPERVTKRSSAAPSSKRAAAGQYVPPTTEQSARSETKALQPARRSSRRSNAPQHANTTISVSSRSVRSRISGAVAALPKDVLASISQSGDFAAALPHLTPRTRKHLSSEQDEGSSEAPEEVEDDLAVTQATELLGCLSLAQPVSGSSKVTLDPLAQASKKCQIEVASPANEALASLLKRSGQTEPTDFSRLIAAFPKDPIHGKQAGKVRFQKLGEASYSEVFSIGDVVIKIVPLSLEDTPQPVDVDEDLPYLSSVIDVEQEAAITQEMGQLHDGFTKLLRTFVVQGSYPKPLLTLWDKYDAKKGSENIRPHVLPPSTHYAILVLPNGGVDLESYVFPPKNGWAAAVSVLWQVTRALALAEESMEFEHRDLHWGQILVKVDPSQRSGVLATVIDFGLSRMIDENDRVRFTRFEPEIFEGKGDYQFDVYRMMKERIGDGWESFRPLTNVMWLHYLAVKLLRHKGLRRPVAPKTSSTRGKGSLSPADTALEEERAWYDTLVETEAHLGRAVKPPSKKSRQTTTADSLPQSACDVMLWIFERTQ